MLIANKAPNLNTIMLPQILNVLDNHKRTGNSDTSEDEVVAECSADEKGEELEDVDDFLRDDEADTVNENNR